jgi:hypothetical protein
LCVGYRQYKLAEYYKNIKILGGFIMPLLAGLTFLIQISFAFHALKTGRSRYWLFVIMGFPVLGCVAYYFIEVFPGSREHRSARQAARKLVKKLQPDADLKRRAEELEVCGSVGNKIALAVECLDHQMYGESISLYESCLQGPFAKDGNLLFGLAQAAVEGGLWNKAASSIERLKSDAPAMRPLDVRLLQARLHEGRAETDAALAVYRELIPEFVGMEARYRYGELLLSLGQHEAANQMFNEVLARSKRTANMVEDEQQWVAAARKAVSNS